MPAVSVIVPVVCSNDRFRRALDGIARLEPRPLEVIVVVDGGDAGASADATRPGVRLVRLPRRLGPAAARNAGARAARGDVLFFVDADVVVRPDAIARVAGEFGSNPEIAAVIGSYDDAPPEPNFLSQYKNLTHHYVHQTSREEASTFWGACGAIRPDPFFEVGGFDERYSEPAVEDIELGARLVSAGHRIRLVKTLQVTHLKRWTPLTLVRSDVLARAVPWARVIRRRGHMPDDLNLTRAKRAAAVAACLLPLAATSALRVRAAVPIAGALALMLLAADAGLWRFLFAKRGLVFTIRAMAWHWFQYVYSAAGFAVGVARPR